MASFAMFAGLDKRDEDLLGRHYPLNNGLRETGKSTNKRPFGAGDESATTSSPVWGANKHGWKFERSAAESAHSIADSQYHEHDGRLRGWSDPATAAPRTATVGNKRIYEPWESPRERRRIQRPVSYNGKHYDWTPKAATTPEISFDISPEWRNCKTSHYPPYPRWQPGEEDDFPPYQSLSISNPRLISDNSSPSPAISPDMRPYDPHQASMHQNIHNPSNPNQPSLPHPLNCGKPLETMEVEAAFILMVIRHRTPEAAAMAISRELRFAQEEQQSRRVGSPCGSEDTVVASQFDDGEESRW